MKAIKRIPLSELDREERLLGSTSQTLADWIFEDSDGSLPYEKMELVVVAKDGDFGDWAAWRGQAYGTKTYQEYLKNGVDLDNPVYVFTNGDKLSQDLAEHLFPQFPQSGLTYRP